MVGVDVGTPIGAHIQNIRGMAGVNKYMVDLVYNVITSPRSLTDVFMRETCATDDQISTSCEVDQSASIVGGMTYADCAFQ